MFILKKLNLTLVVFALIMASSCKKEDPDSIAAEDRRKILEYLDKENLKDVAIEDASGLFYVMEEPGEGAHPTLSTPIRIRYLGYYLDDKVFDYSEGTVFYLNRTIQGWRIGIPKFKNGGKGKLIVPSALGYGPYPYGSSIRRNAVLIFDFEIIDMGI
jgi:FKBP-type peptidyl-prolyl cis-trans isomerase FkpA